VAPLRLAAPSAARFVLVTATLPAPLYEHLQAEFPGIVPALGPGLHRSAPGESQGLGFAQDNGCSASSKASCRPRRPACAPRWPVTDRCRNSLSAPCQI